jgi:hypothetical protein
MEGKTALDIDSAPADSNKKELQSGETGVNFMQPNVILSW